jgi:hypothetical protein
MAESTQDAILKKGHSAFVGQIAHPTFYIPSIQISRIFQNVFRQDRYPQLWSQDPVRYHNFSSCSFGVLMLL